MSNPLVLMDRAERVLISSIAAYRKTTLAHDNHSIEVTLKSGEVVTMEYGQQFVRDAVFDWLDGLFDLPEVEVEPCYMCSRSGELIPNRHGDVTYCDECFPSRGYDNFEMKEEQNAKG